MLPQGNGNEVILFPFALPLQEPNNTLMVYVLLVIQDRTCLSGRGLVVTSPIVAHNIINWCVRVSSLELIGEI